MKKAILALAIGAVAQCCVIQASATVVGFEPLASVDGNDAVGNTYVEQGFKFEDLTAGFGFATWGSASTFYTGSTALANNDDSGITQLTRADGGSFNLGSIDLAVLYPGITGDGAVSVTFTGARADQSTVSQTVVVNDGLVQTFSFAGFTNLSSVTWSNEAMYHQFDNLNVTAVPEPGSVAMFLAGIGVLGALGRRRKA
jgi:hypothetical protein